ncbi:hypothetical protein PGT21_016161 [Puccinia graminis f. sp. tritici]|uniref:Uncharacterized protein n=1 Tax=Puccinia graminis f. sp. tritici TaxID=56615 RepID=A0A5B0LKF1_PUCGR|nr:hypothetical protein PGT21_016161 [Puccinia graminis f. sp. tritici]
MDVLHEKRVPSKANQLPEELGSMTDIALANHITKRSIDLYQDKPKDLQGALINARLPLPRTPTPPPLQKGRAIEPAPQGGAGLIARPSESCFRGKTGFRGAGR